MKKKFNKISTPAWLTALKRIKIDPRQLDLKELRPFKELDQYLTESVKGPKEWQYLVSCFRHLSVFAFTLIYEKEYHSLSNCWNELSQLFIAKKDFNDEVFVESWIFCDFPIGEKQETVLDLFEKLVVEVGSIDHFQNFIDCMRSSRFGLYQEVLGSQKTIKLCELFTEKVITIENSIVDYESGEIFLIRLLTINGTTYAFGEPRSWPKSYKLNLENMVKAKLFYFKAASTAEQYQQFMKYAGPYWMSCVTFNNSNPILNPDHYLTYYTNSKT